jgi:hypothetical protein
MRRVLTGNSVIHGSMQIVCFFQHELRTAAKCGVIDIIETLKEKHEMSPCRTEPEIILLDLKIKE